jgi:murein DD-endopeptidase MepM/ murein hydrolase activator NlpD
VPQVAQDAKVPRVEQGTPGTNVFIGLKQRFAAWWSTEQQTTHPSEKKAVESSKPAPVVEQKKPVPEKQINQKTETVKTVAEKPVTKKPTPEAEKKVSAPKHVGNDLWSDKPFCMPLKVMEMRRRNEYGALTHVMKSAFGCYRINRANRKPRKHGGIDFAAKLGTEVYNIFDGKFLEIKIERNSKGQIDGFGHYVIISHQTKDVPSQQRKYLEALGIKTFLAFYTHLTAPSDFLKSQESKKSIFVKAGELIGTSGASGNASDMKEIKTGAHLHFETRNATEDFATFDPLPLFNPSLIKDACCIYINKNLEDPQAHKPFICKKTGCSECHVDELDEIEKPVKKVFSINAALYL